MKRAFVFAIAALFVFVMNIAVAEVGRGSLNTNSNNTTSASNNNSSTNNDSHNTNTTIGGDSIYGNQINNSGHSTSNSVSRSHSTVRNTPNPNTSNLTTSGADTCFGSSTGSVTMPGFGVSAGSTEVDENCVMMKQVKLLTSMGLKDAALVLMMNQDEDIMEAIMMSNPDLFMHLYNEGRIQEAFKRGNYEETNSNRSGRTDQQ